MKLLIVEDSRLVTERLRCALDGIPDLALATAERADYGLESFRSWQPDTVILDIELPVGNGFDLLRAIKRERSQTLVLIFSNHDCYRSYCQREGADAFFDKAADFETLAGVVRRMAEGSERAPADSCN